MRQLDTKLPCTVSASSEMSNECFFPFSNQSNHICYFHETNWPCKRKAFFAIRICKSGLKLDSFYNLLVKECISTDQFGGKMGPTFIEKRKDIIELSQTCTQNTSFYAAYRRKTLVGLVFDLGLLAYCCVRGVPILYKVIVIVMIS